MRLYVLRHGQSPSAAKSGVASDAERPLSDPGRLEVRRMAERLAREGPPPALILTSPLKRAVETALEAAGVLKPRQGLREFEPLSNLVPGAELYRRLREEAAGVAELLVVGHQPQLGDMVAALTGKIVELRPAGLAALETTAEDRADLLWSANP